MNTAVQSDLKPQPVETYLYIVEATAKKILKKVYSSFRAHNKNNSIDTDLYEELYSVGLLALVKAYQTFDITKAAKFGTYAYYRVSGDMIDFIRDKDILSYTDRKIISELTFGHDNTCPSEDEILRVSKLLNTSVDYINNLIHVKYPVNLVSLNNVSNNSDEYGESIFSESAEPNYRNADVSSFEAASTIKALLRKTKLSEKEESIIKEHYFNDRDFKEIAESLQVSSLRIYQIHKRALNKLKATSILLSQKITPEERKDHQKFLADEKKKDSNLRKQRKKESKKERQGVIA